jgi:hypothetical protein
MDMKETGVVWIGLIRLKVRTSGGLRTQHEPPASIKGGEFSEQLSNC